MQPFITLIHTTMSVTSSTLSITAKALIDSSFAGNFISRKLLRHLYLPKIPCKETLNIHSIMGKPWGKGIIMHCSPTLTLCIGCTHHEEILLQVLEGSTTDIILRSPCFKFIPHTSHGVRRKSCPGGPTETYPSECAAFRFKFLFLWQKKD